MLMELLVDLGIKSHFLQFSPNPTLACNSPPHREILIAINVDKHACQSYLIQILRYLFVIGPCSMLWFRLEYQTLFSMLNICLLLSFVVNFCVFQPKLVIVFGSQFLFKWSKEFIQKSIFLLLQLISPLIFSALEVHFLFSRGQIFFLQESIFL